MKRVILLLHGFKRNDINDLDNVIDYFEGLKADRLYNETWFDNFDKDTLNGKYTLKRVNEIVEKINSDNPSELIVVGYSTGSVVGAMIINRIECKNVKFFAVAAPYKIHFLRWFKTGWELVKADRRIRKRLGKERYARVKKMQQDSRKMEKYPIKLMRFIHKDVIGKYAKELKKIDNAYFLMTMDDHILKTEKTLKVVGKKNNEIVLKEFNHGTILSTEKQIFLDWISERI